ncbi:MAG: tricarballylate utilization 4Fe-4S protein TcuB [Phyllobacterium sp.]
MNIHSLLDPVHASATLEEADRLMTVCNSCRYCEGLCAVFPAMEMRRSFSDGDLNYLANLCHGCGACLPDCQFAPPHEFNVNVPQTMAKLRGDTYQAYAWPRAFSGLFERNGLSISLITALSVTIFIAGFAAWTDPSVLFDAHSGPGSFYKMMPHNAMAALFMGISLYVVVAVAMGIRAFWKDIGEPVTTLGQSSSIWQAVKDASTLKYLDGGGVGCVNKDDNPTDRRRLYHHMTFYGFLLCFAATSMATVYHYLFGLEAPYPWYDIPVLLGTVGGIGLVIGPIGLLKAKWQRNPQLLDEPRFGMDVAFIVMLFLTSLTGLLLLVLRATPAMGVLLALHLGVVFSLFFTMPYGKFMHGIYRFLALVRYAKERREMEQG